MVCINGAGGVGKYSFIDFCQNVSHTCDTQIENFSTIDIVRQAGQLLGCTDKSEKSRKFISDLKDLATEYNNHSRVYIEKQIKDLWKSNGSSTIIFVHSREPKQISEFEEYFVKNGIVDNFLSVLVSSSRVKRITTNYDYDYDYYIQNDRGLDELRSKAKVFVDFVNSKFFTDHKGEC